MAKLPRAKFVILVVLDGWGIAPKGKGNAIENADLPNYQKLLASFPHTELGASGESVGLPRGEDGNSETGHLNIGAGRIVYQSLARINMAIADGSFFEKQTLKEAGDHLIKNNSKLHLMGLIGDGGVHSSTDHLYALLHFASKNNLRNVFIHPFTDGRDSPPNVGLTYINNLSEMTKREGVGEIASVMGRYWAMDRDYRWERTRRAYLALIKGEGQKFRSAAEAVSSSYANGKTDEFIEPSIIINSDGRPKALIEEGDVVIFFNFRIDRPRQLTACFVIDDFTDQSLSLDFDPYLERYKKTHIASKVTTLRNVFDRGPKIKNLFFAMMTEYSKTLMEAGAKVIIPKDRVEMPLGRVIAEDGLKQLRVSESEKERFVTYYFNGQRENPFPGEERIIVPSSPIATYDLEPEMRAQQITDVLLSRFKPNVNYYSFALINFANADMVGHTGVFTAAIKAVEEVDRSLGQLMNFVVNRGGAMLVTADHGNVEEMLNLQTGEVDTEHSNFPVPFIAVTDFLQGNPRQLQTGILADVAPTVLSLLGIPIPTSMTGRNLLSELNL